MQVVHTQVCCASDNSKLQTGCFAGKSEIYSWQVKLQKHYSTVHRHIFLTKMKTSINEVLKSFSLTIIVIKMKTLLKTITK